MSDPVDKCRGCKYMKEVLSRFSVICMYGIYCINEVNRKK